MTTTTTRDARDVARVTRVDVLDAGDGRCHVVVVRGDLCVAATWAARPDDARDVAAALRHVLAAHDAAMLARCVAAAEAVRRAHATECDRRRTTGHPDADALAIHAGHADGAAACVAALRALAAGEEVAPCR